jgi:hypothetical protein
MLKLYNMLKSYTFTLQMASKRKRTYQEEFPNYGLTEIEDKGQMKPQCVCLKVLTAESFKRSQLKKRLDNLHSHLSSKPREYFVNLKSSVKRQILESNLRGHSINVQHQRLALKWPG